MSAVVLCQGTALALPLRDASVHCVVTSPPYYGLRDYGTGAWQGGEAGCTHTRRTSLKESSITTESRPTNTNHEQEGWRGGVCGRCGAMRVDQQLGLEDSPDAYVDAMVQVFREVRRVLRNDGTLWCNVGDVYTSGNRDSYGPLTGKNVAVKIAPRPAQPLGLAAKNLLGLPWRLALALQADGWILRSEIIWHKVNPMPESVQDRPTRAHEQVFLFSKQARYYYDGEAVREPLTGTAHSRGQGLPPKSAVPGSGIKANASFYAAMPGYGDVTNGRACRSVWSLASEPSGFQHYAAFPQALVRRCLLAGAPTQVCTTCGKPWVREVERSFRPMTDRSPEKLARASGRKGIDASRNDDTQRRGYCDVHTTGFSPTCACSAGTQPATVLDPFCGSGTTLLVARELGHHAIGLDLSYPYLHDIARKRLGLAQLAAWTGDAPAPAPFVIYDDLPLFGGF